MKKLSVILLGVTALLVTSCFYDDSKIWDELNDHSDRIEKLEKLCEKLNTNVESLQSIVNALKTQDYITSVTPILENGEEVGYTITFAKSGSITIFHGRDGEDGSDGKPGSGSTPEIGVRKDTDGIYYWTLNGEWLLDENGNKIRVQGEDGQDGADGQDGVTPQLKIENGYWYISYDNGASWTRLGKATGENGSDGNDGTSGSNGDSFFQDVRQDDNNVYFVLTDGTELVVPKTAPLSIAFDADDLVVMRTNSTRNIHYTVTSSSPDITVEVLSSADIKAEVVAESAKTGYISIATSGSIDRYSKVVVLVSNGTNFIMHTLKFEAEAIVVDGANEMEVPAEGGEVTLYYLSNVDCEVIVPETADWIRVVETKALREHEIIISVDQNDGMPRRAEVTVLSGSGLSAVYAISQKVSPDLEDQLVRETLMEFYRATGGGGWTNNANWGSDLAVTEWYGIYEVDMANGDKALQVILESNNLNGRIPDSFWTDLPLQGVSLRNNSITGEIPANVSFNSELSIVYLGNNQLSGGFPVRMMTHVGRNGGSLDICYNSFTGAIPAEYAPYQDRVMIYGNYFSGDIPKAVTEHELWWKWWMNVYYQYDAVNTENVAIPGPKFSTQDIDGNRIDSDEEYAGNELTIVMDWDSYSTDMIESINYNYETYKAKGVEVISWNNYDTPATIKEYFTANGIPWRDIGNADIYRITWSPIVLVVDSDGMLVYQNLTNPMNVFEFLDNYFAGAGGDLYESTDYSQDGRVYKLQTATQGNGIDIVLMGDGYSDRLIADGTYRDVMENAMEYLFTEEPYTTFRDHFNVYMVNAVSLNEIIGESTVFSTYFGDGTHVGGNDQTVFTYAQKAISAERLDEAMIVIMQNSRKYAGTCWMYYPSGGDYGCGVSISYFPVGTDGEAFKRVLNHEANGHGFAKLADEYAYESMGAIPDAEKEQNMMLTNDYGWYKNVDYTSNPAQVGWNYFLTDSRYANEGLGVFEGGCTYWTGVWRSTENSIMRHNTGGFNAPSREAIYYRIHKLAYGADWVYDYEDFVAYDAINRSSAAVAKRRAQAARQDAADFVPLAPPVVNNYSWREVMNK